MIIVIDGSSLLTTHYYGSLPSELRNYKEPEENKVNKYHLIKHNAKGTYVNGVESVLFTIFDLLENNDIDKMVVCFDQSRNTFRKELYPEYKNNRSDKPIPLQQQFDTLQDILNHIGIKTLISEKYEADDLAGSVIEYLKSPFEDTYFITKDHDWFQLVDDDNNVKGLLIANSIEKADELRHKYDYLNENNPFMKSDLHIPQKMVCMNSRAVFDMDKVYPYQIADKKGLAGDQSDNIPGVYKIGDVTATTILFHYDCIENLYQAIENMNESDKKNKFQNLKISKKAISNIIDDKEIAFLSKELATIITDCKEIPKDYNDYKVNINVELFKKAIKYYRLDSLERFIKNYE